eukprot:6475641-Amphidinium_carterae.1
MRHCGAIWTTASEERCASNYTALERAKDAMSEAGACAKWAPHTYWMIVSSKSTSPNSKLISSYGKIESDGKVAMKEYGIVPWELQLPSKAEYVIASILHARLTLNLILFADLGALCMPRSHQVFEAVLYDCEMWLTEDATKSRRTLSKHFQNTTWATSTHSSEYFGILRTATTVIIFVVTNMATTIVTLGDQNLDEEMPPVHLYMQGAPDEKTNASNSATLTLKG